MTPPVPCPLPFCQIDLSKRPFHMWSDDREVVADTVIIATGAVARRLEFPGSGEGKDGFWMKGISACAVCDGAAPMFRNAPIAVIGGGDSGEQCLSTCVGGLGGLGVLWNKGGKGGPRCMRVWGEWRLGRLGRGPVADPLLARGGRSLPARLQGARRGSAC